MMLKFKTVLVGLLITLLVGCGAQTFAPDEDANKMAEEYLVAVKARDYDKAFTMVSDEFFSHRPKDSWMEYYQAISDHMGPVISVKLKRKHVDSRLTGQFYMYQFSIKHENGFTKEMVTFIQKINSDEPLKVLAHKIDSSKLAKINSMF